MGFGANFGSFASGLSQGINNGITLIQARDAARKRRAEREADETFKTELKGVFGQQGGAGGAPVADGASGNVGASAATEAGAYEKLTSEINGRFNALETTLRNRQSLEDAAYVAYADMGEKYFPHLLNESMMGEGGWDSLDIGTKRREVFMQGEALAAFNKATGLDVEDIVVNKGNGGLTTWRRGEGDAEDAVGSYPTIMDAETFAAMRGRVGSGGGYDFSTGRYLGQADYDLSRTAWMRDRGEGYFTGMTAREANADYSEWRKERIADQRYAEQMGLRLDQIQYGRLRGEAAEAKAEAERKETFNALVRQYKKDGLSDKDAEDQATLALNGFGGGRRGRGTGGTGNFAGEGEGGGDNPYFGSAKTKLALDDAKQERQELMELKAGDPSNFAKSGGDAKIAELDNVIAGLQYLLRTPKLGLSSSDGGAEGGEAASGAGMTSGDIDAATKAGTPLNTPAAKQQLSASATAAPVVTAQANTNNAATPEAGDEATPAAAGIEDEIEELETKLFGEMSWDEAVKRDHSHENDVQRIEMAQRTEHSRSRKSGLKPKDYSKALAERKAEQSEWLGSDYRYNIGTAHQYQKDAEAAVDRANAAAKYADAIERDKKTDSAERERARERAKTLKEEAQSKQEAYLQFLREIDEDFGFHARNERARKSMGAKSARATNANTTSGGDARRRGLR